MPPVIKYFKLANRAGKEFVESMGNSWDSDFPDLRERYLMYRLHGYNHDIAIDMAILDIYEDDDDERIVLTKAQKEFLSLIVVFSSGEELNDCIEEIRYRLE